MSTAADGFEALLQFQDQVPDLILSDLNMPAMSGFELLSVVRRRFPNVVAVATSGAYSSGCVPPGVIADAFYAKGREDAGKLLEIIAEALRSGPIGYDKKTAPVWIPRNGKDHNGVPFVVLTCTECLRSFPVLAWYGSAYIAQQLRLDAWKWQAEFVLFWILPSVVSAMLWLVALAWETSRTTERCLV